MAESTEFSRLVFKRTATSGTEPTVPSTETIDENWLATDLKKGEAFVNLEDDRAWIRTNNGIRELSLSGSGITASTTDATPTTVTTITTEAGEVIWFEIITIGLQTDSTKGIEVTQVYTYRNNGGTLSNIGVSKTGNSDFTTADSGISVSGNDINITVTGEAATNIEWSVQVRYHNLVL